MPATLSLHLQTQPLMLPFFLPVALRLEEEPTVPATLADLTCDSDGKVDRFINPRVSGGHGCLSRASFTTWPMSQHEMKRVWPFSCLRQAYEDRAST